MGLDNLPFPLPPFYFPTRVLHVDDHAHYLQLLPMLLGPDVYVESHVSARAALAAAERSMQRSSAVTELIYRQKGVPNQVVLDVAGIHRILYDPQRFSEISVILADWHMPEMTGIEFLKKLPLHNAGAILLTGRADQATAIDAFNRGIIDKFIEKTSPTLAQDLQLAIMQLQWRYFRRNFSLIAETLELGDFRFLRDEPLIDVLRTRFVTIDAVEMYVCDRPHGLIFIDADGKVEFIGIVSREELFALAEEARGLNVPDETRKGLINGDLMPIFERGQSSFDPRAPALAVTEYVAACHVAGSTGDYYVGKLTDPGTFRVLTIECFTQWVRNSEQNRTASPGRSRLFSDPFIVGGKAPS